MTGSEFFIATNLNTGMLIRLERIRRGWRQIDLAEKADITQAEVSAFERGLYVTPAVRQRIAQTLDMDLRES